MNKALLKQFVEEEIRSYKKAKRKARKQKECPLLRSGEAPLSVLRETRLLSLSFSVGECGRGKAVGSPGINSLSTLHAPDGD